jgi:hypothetical protein
MFLSDIIHVHDDTKYYKIPTECNIIAVYSSKLCWYFIVYYGILFPCTVSMSYKNINLFFNDAVSTSHCTVQKSNIIKGVIRQIDCKTKRLLHIFQFYSYT